MNDRQAPSAGVGIAAVERDTGLSKDILRVWERRYGFPRPDRDALGERLYRPSDLDKLRLLRRLVDAGHRPGRIVGRTIEELRGLAEESSASADKGLADPDSPDLAPLTELVRTHRVEDLRSRLSQSALRLGLERFITEVCAPLTGLIGEEWARGALEIYEEHLYTESVQSVLRSAIAGIPQQGDHPRILLTTFPNEPHGLGLLMAEAIMALDGARCLALGPRTPVRDIVQAARSQRADVVALSFSTGIAHSHVEAGLIELRASLPIGIEIWAGGGSAALSRRRIDGVVVLSGLGGIRGELARWRSGSAGASE